MFGLYSLVDTVIKMVSVVELVELVMFVNNNIFTPQLISSEDVMIMKKTNKCVQKFKKRADNFRLIISLTKNTGLVEFELLV